MVHGYIKTLREQGLLSHIKNNPLTRENGIIMVACGDCDSFDELYEFEKVLSSRQSGKKPRIHLLALDGGGLLVHPKSPLHGDCSASGVCRYQIKCSTAKKGIRDVILYGHDPCENAVANKMTLEDSFQWLAYGAAYTASMFSHLNVTCNFHYECDTDTGFKSEYFDYVGWLKTNQTRTAVA